MYVTWGRGESWLASLDAICFPCTTAVEKCGYFSKYNWSTILLGNAMCEEKRLPPFAPQYFPKPEQPQKKIICIALELHTLRILYKQLQSYANHSLLEMFRLWKMAWMGNQKHCQAELGSCGHSKCLYQQLLCDFWESMLGLENPNIISPKM